jgi:hypothetical protein
MSRKSRVAETIEGQREKGEALRRTYHPRKLCASGMSGLSVIVLELYIESVLPPKSPTLTPPERHSARVARPVDNGEVSFRYLGERKAAWAGKERENKRVEKMSEMKGQGAGRVKRTNRLVGGFAGNGSHLGTFLDDGEDI